MLTVLNFYKLYWFFVYFFVSGKRFVLSSVNYANGIYFIWIYISISTMIDVDSNVIN